LFLHQELPEFPTKCVTTTKTLAVKATIQYIDFEGRSDGESIRKLIESMKPKRTIVVRGSPESCQALYSFCLSTGKSTDSSISDNKAFIARRGETIDATIESHIYQVRLKDSLLSSLKFGKTRDAEVAWIDARLTYQVITTKQPKLLIEPFCYHPLKFWFIGRRFAGLG